jgi:hypothetical protein
MKRSLTISVGAALGSLALIVIGLSGFLTQGDPPPSTECLAYEAALPLSNLQEDANLVFVCNQKELSFRVRHNKPRYSAELLAQRWGTRTEELGLLGRDLEVVVCRWGDMTNCGRAWYTAGSGAAID